MNLLEKLENLQRKEDLRFVFQEETFSFKMGRSRLHCTVINTELKERGMDQNMIKVNLKGRNH
jgi:hypothetical protein